MESKTKTFENHLFNGLKPCDFVLIYKLEENLYKYENTKFPERKFSIKKFPIPEKNELENRENFFDLFNALTLLHSYSCKPEIFSNYYGYYKEKEINEYFLVFDNFSQTLENFMKELKNPLEFSRLKNYYYSLLYGLVFLQSLDISHNEIEIKNIVLNETNCLKINDRNFAKFLSKQKLKTNEYFKRNLFSFGSIILEMGISKRIIYNDPTNTKIQMKNYLFELKSNYKDLKEQDSKEFKKISRSIKKCLDIGDTEELDFIDLFKFAIDEEKILYHISLESLTFQDIHELFEKRRKIKS